ncbi:hypothetical protein NMG60_11036752 [Bertholletia excelsa]
MQAALFNTSSYSYCKSLQLSRCLYSPSEPSFRAFSFLLYLQSDAHLQFVYAYCRLNIFIKVSRSSSYTSTPTFPSSRSKLAQLSLARSARHGIRKRDGGNVALHEIDGNVVCLQLQGARGSCPSSVITMKMGIEHLEPVEVEETGLQLNEENIEQVLKEVRPYLDGAAGGSLELVVIEEPIVRVRITGLAAGIITMRVAVTQKLRENTIHCCCLPVITS